MQEENARKTVTGRLVSLSHASQGVMAYVQSGVAKSSSSMVVINFPSMPDAIDLVRTAEYRVTSAYQFPDGVHVYKSTAPLKIPFSFTLHAFDREYCNDGPMTLMSVAAKLHSLTLPLNANKPQISANMVGASYDASKY